MKPLCRRSVIVGSGAAVTMLPAMSIMNGTRGLADRDRVEAAVAELKSALLAYYPGGKLGGDFNGVKPERLEDGSVACVALWVDRLHDPEVRRNAGLSG
jgi:hypothetical protein